MINKTLTLVLILLLGLSCGRSEKEVLLMVSNPHSEDRDAASMLFTREEISGWIQLDDTTLPVLYTENGEALPCQADDVDGDGKWDELFALIDMKGGEQKRIALRQVAEADYPEFTFRSNLRLGAANQEGYPELKKAERLEGVSYHNYSNNTSAAFQMEGPAWENDKVGFRNYFDQRNGMDIFGKSSPAMVLDDVGKAGTPSYHEPAQWGMDVLKVGTSLGAGALALALDDNFFRVGATGEGSYEVLLEGSQRSRFMLDYRDMEIGEQPVALQHIIEIAGGKHYYQSTVSYSGSEEPLKLVTGIVNMHSDSLHVLEADPNHIVLLTHDKQAEDSSYLAMALIIPTEYFMEYGTSKDSGEGITQTYWAKLDSSADRPVSFRFYALWEGEDPRWASLDEVSAFLRTEAERWTQSLVYKVLR